MTKSLRDRQLKTQIVEALKAEGKPLRFQSIYCRLEKSGDKLDKFWRERVRVLTAELVKEKEVRVMFSGNLKAYAWADPDAVVTYPTTTYRGNYKTHYTPESFTPARDGAMDYKRCQSAGVRC